MSLDEKVYENIGVEPIIVASGNTSAYGGSKLRPEVFEAMQKAPVTEVKAPIESRVKYLLRDYNYLCADPELLKAQISFLSPYQRNSQIDRWQRLIDLEEWPEFVTELLEHHYDPSYARSQKRWAQYRDEIYELQDLTALTLDQFADALLQSATPPQTSNTKPS